MNCATCKVNKIGPKTAPFGGYLCGNEHLQCGACNAKTDGQCGICDESTSFVQMNFNRRRQQPPECTAQPYRGPTPMAPTAPSPEPECHPPPSAPLETRSSYVFPKAFFADIETQSSISQEQLSMHDSRDSLSDDQAEASQVLNQQVKPLAFKKSHTDVAGEPTPTPRQTQTPTPTPVSMSLTMSGNQSSNVPHERIQMETLFFGANQQQKSASNFTFQFRPDNAYMSQAHQPKDEANSLGAGDHMRGRREMDVVMDGKTLPEQDTEEVIHTSEIRFMESTESMKNYYSGGTMHPILKVKNDPPPNMNQQESLSVKLLHDFECQNTANPSELVENYLRSYGPLALCQFPAYSFNHNGSYDSGYEAQQVLSPTTHMRRQAATATMPAHMRTVSVSTESEPTLAGACPTKKNELPAKYFPPDYFVMQATGVAAPSPGVLPNPDKIARPSIDIRMQKVLETFQEDPRQPKVSEKPLLEQSKNFIKILAPEPPPVAPQTSAAVTHLDQVSLCEIPAEKPSNAIVAQLSNSHRAFYNPPAQERICSVTQQPANYQCIEPPPQFQLISCSTMMATDLLVSKGRYINMKPTPACQLTIPRPPIQCPESACRRMIFVSDFNKHLIVDHSMLPMERIAPRQCKNFFLDPRLAHSGVNKCHLLYLIRDKITDLGSSKFKDFLPLLVMSTRVHLSDLCGLDPREHSKFVTSESNIEFLMIWLTGIVPEEFPVAVSLTVWPRSGQVPACHLVHSGEMYSVRRSQKVTDVCQSGQMLLLSATEVQLLTNNGKEMLELQIVVH